jgi:hypothetical protein
MPYIYSTLTCDNIFAVYAPKTDPKALSRIIKRILILGGHGMKSVKGLDTPQGVVTKVSDEDLALLEDMLAFRQHVESGFLVVDKKQVDPAKKIANMKQKDGSAPLTPKDFEKSEDSTNETPIYKEKKAG